MFRDILLRREIQYYRKMQHVPQIENALRFGQVMSAMDRTASTSATQLVLRAHLNGSTKKEGFA